MHTVDTYSAYYRHIQCILQTHTVSEYSRCTRDTNSGNRGGCGAGELRKHRLGGYKGNCARKRRLGGYKGNSAMKHSAMWLHGSARKHSTMWLQGKLCQEIHHKVVTRETVPGNTALGGYKVNCARKHSTMWLHGSARTHSTMWLQGKLCQEIHHNVVTRETVPGNSE